MGIKFSDIIALAKSGYSVSDVKELMQLSEAAEVNEPEAPEQEETPAQDPEPEEDQADYKKLYEEEQEKVRRLQAENINKNAQIPDKTDQEILMDMARDFM